MRLISAFVFWILLAVSVQAQQSSTSNRLPISSLQPALPATWTIEEVTDGSVPAGIVPHRQAIAENGLPDGRVAKAQIERDIAEAWYSEPTGRYAHGVLGDAIEAGSLKIRTNRGVVFTFRLPRTEVFEDITPRLADLDGDGTTEVITILSSRSGGGSVAVFGLVGNAFIKKAQSPFIGRSNIAGIAGFSGSGGLEIAIVETPHLAGLFKLYFYDPNNDTLRTNMVVPGFSNHQIGSRELRLSALGFVDGDRRPDLVVPSLDRRTLYIVSPGRNGLKLLSRIELPARVDKAIGVEGQAGDLQLTVGLDDGKVYRITQ